MKRAKVWITGLTMTALAGCAAQGASVEGGTPAPAAGGGAAAATGAAGGAVSVYSGVYTAAQATRGRQVQQRECANCHSTGDWSQGRLLSGWTGQTAHDLVSTIQATMPMDGPGRLTLQQYTDIVAFIFQLNDLPAGETELPANEAGLRRITIEYRR